MWFIQKYGKTTKVIVVFVKEYIHQTTAELTVEQEKSDTKNEAIPFMKQHIIFRWQSIPYGINTLQWKSLSSVRVYSVKEFIQWKSLSSERAYPVKECIGNNQGDNQNIIFKNCHQKQKYKYIEN